MEIGVMRTPLLGPSLVWITWGRSIFAACSKRPRLPGLLGCRSTGGLASDQPLAAGPTVAQYRAASGQVV